MLFDLNMEILSGEPTARGVLKLMDIENITFADVPGRIDTALQKRKSNESVIKKLKTYRDKQGPFHAIPKPEKKGWD